MPRGAALGMVSFCFFASTTKREKKKKRKKKKKKKKEVKGESKTCNFFFFFFLKKRFLNYQKKMSYRGPASSSTLALMLQWEVEQLRN